jgi:hypothetical protein
MPRLGEPVEPSRAEVVTPWWRAVDADKVIAPTQATMSSPRQMPWPLD